MVDSGLVGIKNNPWEMGEGNWGREVGSGGVGEREGGVIQRGWGKGRWIGWVTR